MGGMCLFPEREKIEGDNQGQKKKTRVRNESHVNYSPTQKCNSVLTLHPVTSPQPESNNSYIYSACLPM